MNTHRKKARRALSTAIACAAVAVGATACTSDEGAKDGSQAYSVKGEVTTVSVDIEGGDIDVVAGDPDMGAVRVQESYDYDDARPGTDHTLDDGLLKLSADDCGGADTCDVSYQITVPPSVAVELRTGGGDIRVRGTSGEIEAHTNGGDLRIEKSSADRIAARSDGGNLYGSLSEAPDHAAFESAGGDIELLLPRGSYSVDATTSGGSTKVTVPEDDSAPHRIIAHTDGGDVRVGSA